jgi:hypothetical protein
LRIVSRHASRNPEENLNKDRFMRRKNLPPGLGVAPEEISEARRDALIKLGRFAKFATPAFLGLVALDAAGSPVRAQTQPTETCTGNPQTGGSCTGN